MLAAELGRKKYARTTNRIDSNVRKVKDICFPSVK
jgi:hypothetical protein